MRIRQVRQDFWTDEKVGRMPDSVRLFYIGLWCVADDMGWFRWDTARIGALLYPFRPGKRRERDVLSWASVLAESGRLILHPCGCAEIPTLQRHQVIGGKRSKGEYERHFRLCPEVPEVPEVRAVGNGNGKERNVTVAPARAPEGAAGAVDIFALRDEEDAAEARRRLGIVQ